MIDQLVAQVTRESDGESAPARPGPRSGMPRSPPPPNARESAPRRRAPTTWAPSLWRVLRFLRSEVAAGRGWPTCATIAAAMRYVNEGSARDALYRLEALGLIRRTGAEPRRGGPAFGHGRVIWEFTSAGLAPDAKYCRACCRKQPVRNFFSSAYTADGLSTLCRRCTAGHRDGRRWARVAARVAAR
jgi:hypothetical protein